MTQRNTHLRQYSWKPGQSGNPGGPPARLAELRKLAMEKAPEAIAKAFHLMNNAENEAVQLKAADLICKWAGLHIEMTPEQSALTMEEAGISREELALAARTYVKQMADEAIKEENDE